MVMVNNPIKWVVTPITMASNKLLLGMHVGNTPPTITINAASNLAMVTEQ